MANPGIVSEDFGFASSIGHEADHELYGKPGAADDAFTRKYLQIRRNPWKLGSRFHPNITTLAGKNRAMRSRPTVFIATSFGAERTFPEVGRSAKLQGLL